MGSIVDRPYLPLWGYDKPPVGSIVVRPYLPYGQNDATAFGGDDHIAFGDMML